MGKNKKKRNKAYTGSDAAVNKPAITRISAVNRSKLGQWWYDRKSVAKPILKTAAIVFVVIIIVIELIKIFVG
jgi:hypothetical protein